MGVCILGFGECGSSSQNTVTKTSNTINKVLTNMVTSTSQSVASTIINIQSGSVKTGAITGCTDTANINQTIDSSQTVTIKLNLNSTSELQTQIANALKDNVKNDTTQTQGVLTTASTESNNATTINNYIENLTQTNITDETKQTLTNIINNFQEGKIDTGPINCAGTVGPSNNANLAQLMVTSQIVDVIMTALKVQTVATTNTNEIATDVSNSVTQENKGLGGLVSDILSTFAKLFGGAFLGTLLFMACPCIVLICCAFAICSGGSSKFGNNIGNKITTFGNNIGKDLKNLKNLKNLKKLKKFR